MGKLSDKGFGKTRHYTGATSLGEAGGLTINGNLIVKAGDLTLTSDLTVDGNITVDGSVLTDGLGVWTLTVQGSCNTTSSINLNGTGNGFAGGNITVNGNLTTSSISLSGDNIGLNGGDLRVFGNCVTGDFTSHGGDGTVGGDGGDIICSGSFTAQRISSAGGDGSAGAGGDGGDTFVRLGNLHLTFEITSSGGNAIGGNGGAGGNITIFNGNLSLGGQIRIIGGNTDTGTGGRGGTIQTSGSGDMRFGGDVNINGGDSISGAGQNSGDIICRGHLTGENNIDINCIGGSGATSGDRGATVTVHGIISGRINFDISGGDATNLNASSGRGGFFSAYSGVKSISLITNGGNSGGGTGVDATSGRVLVDGGHFSSLTMNYGNGGGVPSLTERALSCGGHITIDTLNMTTGDSSRITTGFITDRAATILISAASDKAILYDETGANPQDISGSLSSMWSWSTGDNAWIEIGAGGGVGTVVTTEAELLQALTIDFDKYIRIGASFGVAVQQTIPTAGTLIVSDDPAFVVTYSGAASLFSVATAGNTFRDLNIVTTDTAADIIDIVGNENIITNCRFGLVAATTGNCVDVSGDENLVSVNHMTINGGVGVFTSGINNAVGLNVIV